MADRKHPFKIKYTVEPGNFSFPEDRLKAKNLGPDELIAETDGNDGYCDDLVLVSVALCPHGKFSSAVVLTSSPDQKRHRELLQIALATIQNELRNH